MSTTAPQAGIGTALEHALRLLDSDPALAAEQAVEILRVAPGHPGAELVLGMAELALGQAQAAEARLAALAAAQPRSAATWLALGRARLALAQPTQALPCMERAVALQPALPGAWLALADLLYDQGQREAADAAYVQHVHHSVRDPALMAAADALVRGDLPEAETRLRARLARFPSDVAALRMLAELGARLGHNEEAIELLAQALARAPSFDAARQNYAAMLNRANRHDEALVEVDRLLERDPDNQSLHNLRAVILGKLGDFDGAIEAYARVLARLPGQWQVWLGYGHALKTAGRTPEAIAAYRRAIALKPDFGSAWWSLANLKTVRFGADDIAAMRSQLARPDLDDDARLHFEFALGKALEDAGQDAEAFSHYARGNALRRRQVPYDAALARERTRRAIRTYTREFFAARAGSGCPAPDPIFVVGMPRAGSTLIEQILASHPMVEGTMELPSLIAITRELRERSGSPETTSYHDVLAALDPAELAALGQDYLRRAQVHRREGRPLFIDKMPNNFAHVGLIHLILPNAKIIDARRHPLACCFSNFKQHFARGQAFSYDLEDLGHYYADYVALMAHFDAVLPGRIHRVFHEDMVEDPETQIRALLDYCALPFDPRCLRFYENPRAVRTASSEQVRRPIYREGVAQWRRFEPWLEPLKQALGPVLTAYPAVPPLTDLLARIEMRPQQG
ncbi:tetratricopeptide repeat-containing sulfotransferase family protein [Thermomonas hydrothermalis]|uniref:Tetratricopeptide repeat-containing protein n=1 Tax=Thermomonas hydrothermalis TaxID=213588 RepID=A0A1M4S6G6_9GAMM|nr:tetratricopeptide repeat-containing sulfotransferase family protein [Thermomonas hydrothermalis]SHE27781.1 Tetratricopeptide repeat-containing protein [Thermomonas hydrothermalis]